MATFTMPVMGAALTTDNIVTPVEGGASYLNVGMENATDTWAGDLVIGDTTGSTGDVDNVGAFNESWGWVTPNGGKTNTTVTSGLKVTGNITVQGSGKVVLGGQYKGAASYLGLEATEKITVTGGSLTSAKIVAKDLEVSGGTVSTSTSNCTSGNGYAGGPKQSYIKNSLTLSGGSLSFGYTANVQGIGGGGHRMTAFGSSSSFTMTQTGGTMRVYGDMDLRSGATITQSDNAGIMSLRDTVYMGSSGTTTFDQSGDAAKLVIGRLENTAKLYTCDIVFNQSGEGLIHLAYGSNFAKAGTITLNQSGGGTINLGGGHDTKLTGALPSRGYALSGFENANTTYTIDQTGTGTINVKSDAALTADTVNVGADATLNIAGTVNVGDEATLEGTTNVAATGSLTGNSVKVEGALNVESGGKVNVTSLAVDADSEIANKGSITVGSGAGSTTAGALSVTTGGTLNTMLDGTNAVLNIGADTITEWTMTSGSAFGIGFTSEYFETLSMEVENDIKTYTFTDVVVATVASGSSVDTDAFDCTFTVGDIAGIDAVHWTIDQENTAWSTDAAGNVTLSGVIEYTPWIEIDQGGVDDNSYASTDEYETYLKISDQDVTLNGDNSQTKTLIDCVTVTLGHENALGKGVVITKGESGLIAEDGITAVLPDEVQNSGILTMEGSFEAGFTPTEVELPAAFISTEGKETPDGNGFYREEGGTGLLIVNNDPNGDNTPEGSLYVEEGTTVVVDGTEYELSEDGLAGKTGPDYSIYYIRTEGDGSVVSSSEILDAAGITDVTVEMTESTGELTANTAIAVESTAGTLKTTADAEVSGTLTDTTIEASGGIIAATIEGASTVTVSGTDTTTISGGNTYTGGTKIDGGVLEIDAADSLGTGDIELANGGTLDLNDLAVTNNIKVTGCTLMGAGAYDGDLEVTGDLMLTDATTANKLLMSGAGKISGTSLTVENVDVKTDSDASIAANFTLNENGIIALYNGVGLNVTGSLTLNGVTTLKLEGDYKAGDTLVSASEGLTAGEVVLDFVDDSVMLEKSGNSLILALKYKRELAEPIGFANWGIASASRAFVDSVHGQRNNTACMAGGRGTVWFTIVTGQNDLYGTDVNVTGAVIGADMRINEKHLLGIAFGYVEGDVSPTGFRKVEQEGSYAAVYGEHLLKPVIATDAWTLDWTLAYGVTDSSFNGMSWEQDSVQMNARVSRTHKVSDRLGVNGFVGLEYFATDSATVNGVHTGSIQNLRGELGVGADYVLWGMPAVTDTQSGSILRSGCERLVVSGEISYFSDMVRNDPSVRMNGVSGGVCNPGRNGIEVEVGATYRFNARWSASVNYSYSAMEDSNEHRLNIGASWTF